jgi:hypothetical protein
VTPEPATNVASTLHFIQPTPGFFQRIDPTFSTGTTLWRCSWWMVNHSFHTRMSFWLLGLVAEYYYSRSCRFDYAKSIEIWLICCQKNKIFWFWVKYKYLILLQELFVLFFIENLWIKKLLRRRVKLFSFLNWIIFPNIARYFFP